MTTAKTIEPILPKTETDKIVFSFFQDINQKRLPVRDPKKHPEQLLRKHYEDILENTGEIITNMYLGNPLLKNALAVLMDTASSVNLFTNKKEDSMFETDQYYADRYQRVSTSLCLYRDMDWLGEEPHRVWGFKKFSIHIRSICPYDAKGKLEPGSVHIPLSMLPRKSRDLMMEKIFLLTEPETAIRFIFESEDFKYARDYIRQGDEYWVKTLLGETPFKK